MKGCVCMAKIERNTESFIIKSAFYPTVETHLKNTANANRFFRYVAEYRNRNIDILSDSLILDYLIFERDGEDTKIVYRTCGIDQRELSVKIKEAQKAVALDQLKGNDKSREFCTAMILMMSYYRKDKQKLLMCTRYYVYGIYHLVFKNFFKEFKPIRDVMQYTIDNLNNKYDLVKYHSLEKALDAKIETILQWAESRLEHLSDTDIFDMISAIRTRINDFVKKIANAYFANYEANNRTFVSKETNAEGDFIIDRENNTSMVAQLAGEYTTAFFTNGISEDACRNAARACDVSASELRTAILLLIKDANVREVKQFYEALFTSYFTYDPTATPADIKTLKFISKCDAIYKKSNSTNPNIIIIKKLNDEWLTKGSRSYRVSNRVATKSNFRKAIYLYFVFQCASNKN